jgi:hypothetical protein
LNWPNRIGESAFLNGFIPGVGTIDTLDNIVNGDSERRQGL